MFEDVVAALRDRPMPVGRDVVMGLLEVDFLNPRFLDRSHTFSMC